MKLFYLFVSCILIISSWSCSGKNHINPEPIQQDASVINEPSISANKTISAKEKESINEFVRRKQWDMVESGTGVRYGIYASTNGIAIESGDMVDLEYTLELLDGTPISKTENGETEMVIVDKDNVESGLHEALKYLHLGDKAKVIIPSHLAFGLTGDQDKIPGFSTLVYDIHIVEVSVNEDEK